MLERSFSAVELLERHSEAGRRGRVSGTRELVIPATPFLIAYRVRRNRIEVFGIEPPPNPFEQLTVPLVLLVMDRLKEVGVAPDAAAIIWWAGPGSFQAKGVCRL